MSILKHSLPNGVRILIEPVGHVKSAAVGLWCTTGSRHELEHEAGITHLIEHMLFKGTKRRTAKEIAESIEGRGGSMNAFTDKENTCYYARVLSEDLSNAIDVLSDMMRNSLLDPEELGREKGVVLEEIKRGEDEPSDLVHEKHLEQLWGHHPLGKPVIGTEASVSSFERDHLTAYLDRRYRGGNVVLAVAGNVEPGEVLAEAERRLGDMPPGGGSENLDRPAGLSGEAYIAKDVEQVHFCIGGDGVGVYDQELYTVAVLDSALGGSMSSRLFQEIREKRGLAYSVGSYTLNYSAGGSFTVYGGCSPSKWQTVQEVVRDEFDKVCKDGLSDDELERTKRLIRGHLVLGLEGMNSRMMRMSRNEIYHHRHIPLEETISKIESVTNEGLIELARRLLDPSKVRTTVIGPLTS